MILWCLNLIIKEDVVFELFIDGLRILQNSVDVSQITF